MDWVKITHDAAEKVMGDLGSHYTEPVYEEAILHDFRLNKIPHERQRNVEIIYKGYSVSTRRADCILNPLWKNEAKSEEFLLEMKARKRIEEKHLMQAQVYLVSMNIKKGLVLNFNTTTGEIDVAEVERPNKVFREDIETPIKNKVQVTESLIRSAGEEVLNYLGTEFFYGDANIYVDSVGVELRLKGLHFYTASYPILYREHRVEEYKYDYVFQSGEVAKIFTYKKKDDIESQVRELERYNKHFGIGKGFVLAIPEKENMEVVVRKI